MPNFVDPWDVATPPGTGESRRMGDDRIRELKRALLERIQVEHDFPAAAGAGSGRHKFARDAALNRPSDVVAGSVFWNSDDDSWEIWTGTVWAKAKDPTKLPLAGGTLTGALLAAIGTLAAPGIAFAGDADTGFARLAANVIDVVTGGLARARIAQTEFRLRNDLGLGWSSGDPSSVAPDTTLTRASAGELNLNGAKIWHDTNVNRSESISGFIRFPNGITFQWTAAISVTAGSGSEKLVTLPMAYSTAHWRAVGSFYDFNYTDGTVMVSAHSLSQVKVGVKGASGRSVNVFSVGV